MRVGDATMRVLADGVIMRVIMVVVMLVVIVTMLVIV